jgi:large subunit ribosomal protein L19
MVVIPTLKSKNLVKKACRSDIQKICVGDEVLVTVYLEVPNGSLKTVSPVRKERVQAFEGIVCCKNLSDRIFDATITVRKMYPGGAVEKVFILNSPWIASIKIISRSMVRRSKLYYLRKRSGKAARLKRLYVRMVNDNENLAKKYGKRNFFL